MTLAQGHCQFIVEQLSLQRLSGRQLKMHHQLCSRNFNVHTQHAQAEDFVLLTISDIIPEILLLLLLVFIS